MHRGPLCCAQEPLDLDVNVDLKRKQMKTSSVINQRCPVPSNPASLFWAPLRKSFKPLHGYLFACEFSHSLFDRDRSSWCVFEYGGEIPATVVAIRRRRNT